MSDQSTSDRFISPKQQSEDTRLAGVLRPQRLAEFTGQEKLKTNLGILIEAAQGRQDRAETG